MGKVHVYTGDGKGKTTAALGLALRACGHGRNVLFLQFMKGDAATGEYLVQDKLPDFCLRQFGTAGFVDLGAPDDSDIDLILAGWAEARKALKSGDYDLVVLDELNVAMAAGMIETDVVLAGLAETSSGTDVVITGRGAPDELVKQADLVTELLAIKHYYNDGVQGCEGIEW